MHFATCLVLFTFEFVTFVFTFPCSGFASPQQTNPNRSLGRLRAGHETHRCFSSNCMRRICIVLCDTIMVFTKFMSMVRKISYWHLSIIYTSLPGWQGRQGGWQKQDFRLKTSPSIWMMFGKRKHFLIQYHVSRDIDMTSANVKALESFVHVNVPEEGPCLNLNSRFL
jgi:hypothetical protein